MMVLLSFCIIFAAAPFGLSPDAQAQSDWRDMYRTFLLEGKYKNAGQSYGAAEPYYVALYDMDDDGVPELIVQNGVNFAVGDGAFCYTANDGVRYLGDMGYLGVGFFSLHSDAYPGLYYSNGRDGGWYGTYYYVAGAEVKSESVIELLWDDEKHENTEYRKTSDDALYQLCREAEWNLNPDAQDIPAYSLGDIRDMGWNAFVTECGFSANAPDTTTGAPASAVSPSTSAAPKTPDAQADSPALPGYAAGDILEFGAYPQSEVNDASLLSALSAQALDWKDLSALYKTGMEFADVEYPVDSGIRYRAIRIVSYKNAETFYDLGMAEHSMQDDNGYFEGRTYWFRFEPIRWRVLDPQTGLVLSDTILDSQQYQQNICGKQGTYYCDATLTVYANNYARSTVRTWLNSSFAATAFSAQERQKIPATDLDNRACPDSGSHWEEYNYENTQDRIFLLSYAQAEDLPQEWLAAGCTDYAKCQGIYCPTDSENNEWRLRSAAVDSGGCAFVDRDGDMGYWGSEGIRLDRLCCMGTRPAMRLRAASGKAADFEYTVEDREIVLTRFTGAAVDASIPETITELPVTGVGTNTFIESHVQSVRVPACVTRFGEDAFKTADGAVAKIITTKGAPVEKYANERGLLIEYAADEPAQSTGIGLVRILFPVLIFLFLAAAIIIIIRFLKKSARRDNT